MKKILLIASALFLISFNTIGQDEQDISSEFINDYIYLNNLLIKLTEWQEDAVIFAIRYLGNTHFIGCEDMFEELREDGFFDEEIVEGIDLTLQVMRKFFVDFVDPSEPQNQLMLNIVKKKFNRTFDELSCLKESE